MASFLASSAGAGARHQRFFECSGIDTSHMSASPKACHRTRSSRSTRAGADRYQRLQPAAGAAVNKTVHPRRPAAHWRAAAVALRAGTDGPPLGTAAHPSPPHPLGSPGEHSSGSGTVAIALSVAVAGWASPHGTRGLLFTRAPAAQWDTQERQFHLRRLVVVVKLWPLAIGQEIACLPLGTGRALHPGRQADVA